MLEVLECWNRKMGLVKSEMEKCLNHDLLD